MTSGSEGDTFGDGVMREVLLMAIQSLLLPEFGIVEDLSNDDGFVGLKVSAGSFVSDNTLDNIFTLGALCAIFWLKCHAAPTPISPALIQAVIGGPDTVVDEEWVKATHEQVAEILSLLPVDGDAPIPDNTKLRRLFESRIIGCRVQLHISFDSNDTDYFSSSMIFSTVVQNTEKSSYAQFI